MRRAPATMKVSLTQNAIHLLSESAKSETVMMFLMHASRLCNNESNLILPAGKDQLITTYLYDNVPYYTEEPCGKIADYYSGHFKFDELKVFIKELTVVLKDHEDEFGVTILNKECADQFYLAGGIKHKVTLAFA